MYVCLYVANANLRLAGNNLFRKNHIAKAFFNRTGVILELRLRILCCFGTNFAIFSERWVISVCEQHTLHVTFFSCCTTDDTHTRGSCAHVVCLILFDFSTSFSLLSIFSPIDLSFFLAPQLHLQRCGGHILCALASANEDFGTLAEYDPLTVSAPVSMSMKNENECNPSDANSCTLGLERAPRSGGQPLQ